jgi:hypothetical protein
MNVKASVFEYGVFIATGSSYYENNSCLSSIYVGKVPISYINVSQQRTHGLRANAQESA